MNYSNHNNDKIFSRKRFLIPKFRKFNCGSAGISSFLRGKRSYGSSFGNSSKCINCNNSQNNIVTRKFIKTSIIVIIAICIANRIIGVISPTMDVLCVNMAKSIATRISNEQATIVMGNYKYEDLSSVIRDQQGNIKMIKMNVIAVNEITSDVAIKIQQELDNYQKGEFGIRLGTFTGTKILSGRGPNVPIKMATVGNVETEIVSEFAEAGINQTLHRIYLNVECRVSILTPYDTIEENIVNQVLLAEAVIIGEVPDTYYNLNGMSDGDLLEIVE